MILRKEHQYLTEQALWIIMDPWVSQLDPNKSHRVNDFDFDYYGKMDTVNDYTCQAIRYYLNKFQVRHRCVSITPYDAEALKVYPAFSNWHMMWKEDETAKYLKTHQLKNIVYCGFHHGICVLGKDNGAVNMKKHANVILKRDLTCSLINNKGDYDFRGADERCLLVFNEII